MMQNSRTPLWYICQQKVNIHIKWTNTIQSTIKLRLATIAFTLQISAFIVSVEIHGCLLTHLSFHQSPISSNVINTIRDWQCSRYRMTLLLIIHILPWLENTKQSTCLHHLPYGGGGSLNGQKGQRTISSHSFSTGPSVLLCSFWKPKFKSPVPATPYLSTDHKTNLPLTPILQASFPIYWLQVNLYKHVTGIAIYVKTLHFQPLPLEN